MTKERIYIIDDDPAMRDGLEAYLSADFEVRSFESAHYFLETMSKITPPDCILLDLRMPQFDGFDLQSELNKVGYPVPIIFISADADKADVISAWREGAADFVLKPFSAAEIRSSIDALIKRKSSDKKEPSAKLPQDIPVSITRREAEVLLLLGQGLRQSEVAKKLNIALRTVKMYRSFLKDKLNLNTAVELARFCDLHKTALEHKLQTTK